MRDFIIHTRTHSRRCWENPAIDMDMHKKGNHNYGRVQYDIRSTLLFHSHIPLCCCSEFLWIEVTYVHTNIHEIVWRTEYEKHRHKWRNNGTSRLMIKHFFIRTLTWLNLRTLTVLKFKSFKGVRPYGTRKKNYFVYTVMDEMFLKSNLIKN